jgi:hypothetical protein
LRAGFQFDTVQEHLSCLQQLTRHIRWEPPTIQYLRQERHPEDIGRSADRRHLLSPANGDINLNAATGTSDSTSSNKSWSAGVGVNFGCSTASNKCETSVGANASYGKGSSDTSGTSHTNTHVNGTGDVTIVTNDLGLKGATVAGNSVAIDVKNLMIES